MSKEDFEEFSDLVKEFFEEKDYHRKFIKYSKAFETTKNLDDLENAIKNLLLSKKAEIHEIRKGDYDVWVSYTTYPPRSSSLSYSANSITDFISKYPH